MNCELSLLRKRQTSKPPDSGAPQAKAKPAASAGRGGRNKEDPILKIRVLAKEFSLIKSDIQDPTYIKWLGAETDKIQRRLRELLSATLTWLEPLADVDDYNVLLEDKKKHEAIIQLVKSWTKSGGGKSQEFLDTVKKMTSYLAMEPETNLTLPEPMAKRVFEAAGEDGRLSLC